jgi:hypothetical protein
MRDKPVSRWVAAAAAALVLVGVVPPQADELPARKAGLWELNAEPGDADSAVQQCIDASTDRIMQSVWGLWSQLVCTRRDVKRDGDTITTDAACKLLPEKPKIGGTLPNVTVHSVITGSFDSAYTTTMTVRGDALPGGAKTATLSAKWLGPCADDQKPGDIIMGFIKINILAEQKRGRSKAAPMPR